MSARPVRLSALAAILCALSPSLLGQNCMDEDAFENNDSCAEAAPITAGDYPGLTLSDAGDFYRVVVGAGQTLAVRLLPEFPGVTDEYVSRIYSDGACMNQVVAGNGLGTDAVVRNLSGSAAEYWIEVTPTFPAVCVFYGMSVLVYDDPCPGLTPDAFEPNDDSATAALLPLGLTTDLTLLGGEGDFYVVPVLRRQILTVGLTVLDAPTGFEAPRVSYFDVLSGLPQPVAGFGDTSQIFNSTTSDMLGVLVSLPGDPLNCSRYELDVDVMDSACSPLGDDAFEPNQTCAQEGHLTPGLHTGLSVYHADHDQYRVDVPAGTVLRIDMRYPPAGVRPRMSVLRDCTNSSSFESVHRSAGRDVCLLTNLAGVTRSWHIQVARAEVFDQLALCSPYELEIALYPGSIGTVYCASNPNSTGSPSRIAALGSPVVQDGEFALLVEGLPDFVSGIYFVGRNRVQVPFGDGFRCVGGPTQRLQPPRGAGSQGRIFRTVDFNEPALAGLLVPGSTNQFQLWHRDSGSTNLSDAVEVVFQ